MSASAMPNRNGAKHVGDDNRPFLAYCPVGHRSERREKPSKDAIAAVEAWRESLVYGSDRSDIHFRLAQVLEQIDDFDDALKHYRQAIELDPTDTRQLGCYGELLLHLGEFDDARAVLKRCLDIDPNQYDASLALSSLYLEAGNSRAAHKLFCHTMEQYPCILHGETRDPSKPTVLRIRGVDGSAYSIWERPDGRFEYIMRGGHFSIRDLIRKGEINLFILNILGNNIEELDSLDGVDVIVNTIGCPDLKRESLLTAARFVDRNPDIPIINHPRRVLDTCRDCNAYRLNVLDGVIFPKTECLWWDGVDNASFEKELQGLGFTYPFIIRLTGTQTGQSVALINDTWALQSYLGLHKGGTSFYAIQYHDLRRPDGLFNKMRVFSIDGTYYPVANLINDFWQIHSGDRYNVMKDNEWMQEEERRFLKNFEDYLGKDNTKRLKKINEVVSLDFFGIDFTTTKEGELFIFELNPAMRHNFDHVESFGYTEPYLQQISQAFHKMVRSRI